MKDFTTIPVIFTLDLGLDADDRWRHPLIPSRAWDDFVGAVVTARCMGSRECMTNVDVNGSPVRLHAIRRQAQGAVYDVTATGVPYVCQGYAHCGEVEDGEEVHAWSCQEANVRRH